MSQFGGEQFVVNSKFPVVSEIIPNELKTLVTPRMIEKREQEVLTKGERAGLETCQSKTPLWFDFGKRYSC